MEKIRQGYREEEGKLQSPPWCEEFNFSLENLFTRLKNKDGQIEQIDHLTGIFRENKYAQKPRTVLIEGKSGMGKTTYCQKLAYDWASNQEELEKLSPQIQVLLSLKCEEISSDIWKAIDAQLLPEDVDEQSKEMFFKFIQENQSNVLLILDGLDDMSPDNLNMISQLVKRELPQCHFLLTAERATAVKARECCGTWLEIVGFTEEDGKKFISEYFKNQESLAKKLFDLLDEFDYLREELFPGNPIYTALLCLLCKDLNGVFPTSRTQVYTEMILCALRRYETIKGMPSGGEDLIEVYKDNLTSLGLKAFNFQRKGDPKEDEGTLNTKDLPGFTSAQTVGGTSRLWYAFQQFFAGFFVAFQILSGKIDLNGIVADESYFEPPLRQVFLFMSGILSLQSEEKAQDLVKSICSRINSLALGSTEDIEELEVLLRHALECSEYATTEYRNKYISTLGSCLKIDILAIGTSPFPRADYRDLLESGTLKWSKLNANRPSLFGYPHFASLARPFSEALKHNSTLNSLHLNNCTPYDKQIDSLWAEALSGALKVNSSLTNLDLRSNRIGASGAQALSDALEINTTLTKLDLSGNVIGATGARFLSKAIKINASLTALNLSDNKISTGELRQESRPRPYEIAMIPTFFNLGRCTLPEALKKLDEFSTGMDETMEDYGLFSLSESLKTNTTLTNLNLESNSRGDSIAPFFLSEIVKTNATLTTLNLRNNSQNSFSSKCLSFALRTNGTLTSLDLGSTGINVQALSEGLKVNTALTSLNLASNGIGDSGAKALSDVLQVNATLTKLHLGWNGIGAEGTQYICKALAGNNTLTSLDFSWNEIGGAGVLFLSEALQSNKALNDLNLNFIQTDERGAICLFDALKHNTTLSTLDLTGLGAVLVTSKKSMHVPFCHLLDALKVNTTLSCLRLGRCRTLSPSDAQLFFSSLMDNKTLKELDLNELFPRFKVPPEFLASNTTLTHLNLSSSLSEDPSVLAPFFEALSVNSTLTCLKLADVEIMDSNCSRSKIGDSECEWISETLKVNTTLTDLDLSLNSIGKVGVKCIMGALKVNTSLKFLNLCCQREGYRSVTNPPSVRKVNTSVFVYW